MNSRLCVFALFGTVTFFGSALAQPPRRGSDRGPGGGADLRGIQADLAKLKAQIADLESRLNKALPGQSSPGGGGFGGAWGPRRPGSGGAGSGWRANRGGRGFARPGYGRGGQHGHHGWGRNSGHGRGYRGGFGYRGRQGGSDINARLDRIERELQTLLRSMRSGR